MKIKISKSKFVKNLLLFSFLTILCFSVSCYLLVYKDIIDLKGLFLIPGILLFGFLTFHLIRNIKNLNRVVIVENGTLMVFSSPLTYGKIIKLRNIESIYLPPHKQKVNQAIIKLKRASIESHSTSLSRSFVQDFINQIKGNDVYITDSILDYDDLKELVKFIEKSLPNTALKTHAKN